MKRSELRIMIKECILEEGSSNVVEKIKASANEFQRALNKFEKSINSHIDTVRNLGDYSPKELKSMQAKADKAYDEIERAMDDMVEAAIG